MGIIAAIVLILVAALLFWAVQKGYINDRTLATLAAIAGIGAFAAAVMLFIIPAASPSNPLGSSTTATSPAIASGSTSEPQMTSVIQTNTAAPPSATSTPTNTSIPLSPTPKPTATNTPEPTPLPVFTYTFEKGINKDWEVVEDFGYANGNLQGEGFMLYNKQPKNYKVKIHMQGVNIAIYVNTSGRTSGYFFICRNDQNVCQWYVSKNPGFGAAFGQTRNVESVSPSVDLASVVPEGTFYDLEITVNDGNFSAAINGQDIVGFAGSYYTEGKIGISGGAGEIQSIEITYLP